MVTDTVKTDKEDQELSIGFATFNDKLSNKERNKLIKIRKTEILTNKIWKIQYGMYVRQKWPQLLSYMKQSRCQRIDLHDNQYPQILKSLCFPCFTNIVTLVLQKNKICNVEALSFLNMETLNFIDLDDNQITNIKVFNKLKWPLLRKLQLRNNNIQEGDFSRMKVKDVFQKIYLDERIDVRMMTQSINILAKLQSNFLLKLRTYISELEIEAKRRISEQKTIETLKRKYIKMTVFQWEFSGENIFQLDPDPI